jgi:hypothetical protein
MEDRQDHAIKLGVQKLVGVPAGCQRTGLGLAIADDGGDEEVRIIERRPVGMRQ